MNNNASDNLKALLSQMDNYVSTKTVVGEPVKMGDVTVIPLIDVSLGMLTGVSSSAEADSKGKDGGAGGVSAKMTPSAVIIVTNGTAQLVKVKGDDGIGGKIMDMLPGAMAKLSSMFGKKEDEEAESEEQPPEETL